MTDEEYYGKLQARLREFCPNDVQLVCNTTFEKPDTTCGLCDTPGIRHVFVLENPETHERRYVGKECIQNYKKALEMMRRNPQPIAFPPEMKESAASFNQQSPGSAIIDDNAEGTLEPWVTKEEEDRERRLERGLDLKEDDREGQDEEEREELMGMGLDPDDPDFENLAPHGMEADGDDDEEIDDSEAGDVEDELECDDDDDVDDEIDDCDED